MSKFIPLCALFMLCTFSAFAQAKEERITQGVVTETTTTRYEMITTTESRRMTKEEWAELKQQRRAERQANRDSMAVVRVERAAERQRFADSMVLVRAEQTTRMERDVVDSATGVVNMPLTNEIQPIEGYEWVDLGLSVKWATCNLGADNPEDYGNYYAWGETTPKSSYAKENSKTYGKSMNEIGGDTLYDAATVNRGASWRLPTKNEFNELIINCKWKWTTRNGVRGYEVTSRKNGNSIFLPATGCFNGESCNHHGSIGYYWSSLPDGTDDAGCLYFYDMGGRGSYVARVRYNGRSVRPVTK